LTAPKQIVELVERFENNIGEYRAGHYNETELRRDFVDPFFEALGWDVGNKKGNCSHKCNYCYNTSRKDENRIKKSSIPAIEKSLKNMAAAGDHGPVHFSFIGDPYEIGRDTTETRTILELFNQYPVNFQILTKGGTEACRDFDLYREGDRFGCTLTFVDPEKSREWEPGAALPENRIETLKKAHTQGLETWVSMEHP